MTDSSAYFSVVLISIVLILLIFARQLFDNNDINLLYDKSEAILDSSIENDREESVSKNTSEKIELQIPKEYRQIKICLLIFYKIASLHLARYRYFTRQLRQIFLFFF